MPKYPEVVVQLSGEDGNSAFIMARVARALRRGGVPEEVIHEFYDEAKSAGYYDLINTVERWVEVE